MTPSFCSSAPVCQLSVTWRRSDLHLLIHLKKNNYIYGAHFQLDFKGMTTNADAREVMGLHGQMQDHPFSRSRNGPSTYADCETAPLEYYL